MSIFPRRRPLALVVSDPSHLTTLPPLTRPLFFCTTIPYQFLETTMDSDFLQRIQNMSLTAEEETDIPVQHNHRQRTLEECSLSLIGRLLTDKPYNQRAAKNLFRSVWKLGNDLKIMDVGNALFQFRFKLESQLQWVVDNGSWSFDDHLLLVRRWEKV